jgi:uncharacterized phage-associated protein
MPRIRFNLNQDKAVETLVYLASRQPGIDFFHLAKVIYFAEKAHLNEYGRPILGDAYMAMEHGPVPSYVYDVLKLNPFLPGDALEEASTALEINHGTVIARRAPREDVFSRTDRECLDWSLGKFGRLPFRVLWDLGHAEEAWSAAQRNGQLDYVLMIEPKNRERLVEELSELGPDIAL